MTTSQLQRLRRILVPMSLVLASVCGAGLAWGGEAPDAAVMAIMATPTMNAALPIVTPPLAATPLTKLRALSNRASELTLHAIGMLGIDYKYGGNTPENGLDCSGLVRYVFKESWGTILPRSSVEISRVGEKVDSKDLQAGDLVFYNTLKRGFSHVGIYLGDNKFIHSPSSGGQVRIESMDLGYWKKRFNGARRVADPAPQ